MKTNLYSFLLSCLFLSSNAQWQSKGPYGGIIRDIGRKLDLFAATNNGVYTTTNNGTSWQPRNAGMERIHINAITFGGMSTMFAGSGGSGIFVSTDGGNSWTKRNNGLTSLYITTMFSTNEAGVPTTTRVFAATPDGVFMTTNNGMLWTPANNGITGTYEIYSWAKITHADTLSNDTLLGGTYGEGLWMTNNYGQSWNKLPGLSAGSYIYALDHFRYGNGGNYIAGTNSGVFISTDRGTSWTSANTGFPGTALARTFHERSISSTFYQDFAGTHFAGIYRSPATSYPGYSWTPKNNGIQLWPNGGMSRYPTINRITDLSMSGSDFVHAATDNGMYRSPDDGNTWSDANTGILATDVVALATGNNMICAGTNGTGVYMSDDQGTNWDRTNNGLPQGYILAAAIKGNMALVSVQNFKVYRSTDGGASWASSSSGLGRDPFIMEADNQRILAVTQGFISTPQKLCQSTDGISWTEIPTAPISGGMTALAANGNEIYVGTSNGMLFRTTNDGTSWDDLSLYLPDATITAIVVNGEEVYVGTQGKGIFRLTNNGNTIVPINDGMNNHNVTDLLLQDGLFVASTWGGGIFVSTNYGNSWAAYNGGLANQFVYHVAADATELYVGTDAGVYQTGLSDIVVFTGISKPIVSNNVTVFPNPVKDKLTITIKNGNTVGQLYIYDMRMQLVNSGELKGYSTEVPLPETSGIYFVQVQSEEGTKVFKVIKE